MEKLGRRQFSLTLRRVAWKTFTDVSEILTAYITTNLMLEAPRIFEISEKLHGDKTQKSALVVLNAVRTSNPMAVNLFEMLSKYKRF